MNKIVKFTRHHPPYNVGDGASFEPHVAAALVKAGYADFVAEPEIKKSDARITKPKADDLVTKG